VGTLGDQISKIIEKLPDRSLYAPEGSDHDTEFLNRYLEYISSSLDNIEVLSFGVETQLSTKLSMAYISLRVATERRRKSSIQHDLHESDSTGEQNSDDRQIGDSQSSTKRIEAILR